MASGLGGGGAAANTVTAPASSPQATAPQGNGRGGDGRQQDTFAGLLAGATPAADTAPAASSTLPAVKDTSSEDTVIDDALPEQILNLIGGAWPLATPPLGTESQWSGDVAGDPSATGELPITALSTDATILAVTDATDLAPIEPTPIGLAPIEPAPGKAPATATASAVPTLPPAQSSATGAADAPNDPAIIIDQATGSDTTAPSADAEGADPIEFILPGQQTMASSSTRSAAPAQIGAAVAMPADPDAGFDDSFGARIGWMAEQRIGHAQIRVSPDHVGPIDVRLQLDGNRVSAEFVSANADVRQALEASVGRLRELLDQQGLQLAHTDVGSGQSNTSGERAATDTTGTPGFGDGGGIADDLPEPPLMRRGLLDEYA